MKDDKKKDKKKKVDGKKQDLDKAPGAGNVSKFEEDPVHDEFMVNIDCLDADKRRETDQRAVTKKDYERLLEKLRKIQESLNQSKNDPDFLEMVRF